MEQSRFGKYNQRRTPRHKRSRTLEGAFEDKNRWIRCWYCGAINDLNRVSNGNPDYAGNVYYEQITPSPATPLIGDEPGDYTLLPIMCQFQGKVNLMELGAGSVPQPINAVRKVETPTGCWFCGTNNLP